LKLLFSIFLSITILLSSFSNAIVYVTFKINQTEIAKTLCVLRAKKDNTCNGNCVLRAELKKQAENEKKHDSLLKEKSEIVYTNSVIDYDFSTNMLEANPKTVNCYLSSKPKSRVFEVFHPPTV
jgi:hypothetical protein